MKNPEIIRQWYITTISTLLSLVFIYIISHAFIPGAEIIKLSKQEITDINLIVFGTVPESAKLPAAPSSAAGQPKTTVKKGLSQDSLDLKKKDSLSNVAAPESSRASDSIRKATAYNYIFSVRGPLCQYDSIGLRKSLESFNTTKFVMVIANFPIRVKSYFWLTGGSSNYCGKLEGSVYLEITFWTWFGLIASLLFSVSDALQTADFDSKQIGLHISKFFYAPFVSLVIYFSINRLISDGATSMGEFSHGTLVLSFILGFFSRRAIDLIDRIKELILPLNNNTGNNNTANNNAGTGSGNK